MLRVANILFIMASIWYCSNTSTTCRTSFTTRPMLGHRCVINDPSNQSILLNTARTQCLWKCLSSDDCVVVSYNHLLNICELSRQLCDTIASAADFSMNVYGMRRQFCSQWVPASEFDEQGAIVFPQRLEDSDDIAVARKKVESALFPGKYQLFGDFKINVAVDENTVVKGQDGEVLLVDPACLFAWVPYQSPNVLPLGAFVGGYDSSKEDLYVARSFTKDTYSIGYYKPSTSFAYFVKGGQARTSETMDILVIVWALHNMVYHIINIIWKKGSWSFSTCLFAPSARNHEPLYNEGLAKHDENGINKTYPSHKDVECSQLHTPTL